MQRIISIPLLILYLAASVGIQGVSHFCGDDLVSTALFSEEKGDNCDEMTCCDMPGSDQDEECCTNVKFAVFYESERSLTLTSNTFELEVPDQQAIPFSFLLLQEPEDQNTPGIETFDLTLPPAIPIYLQHHSLIFYG